MEFELRNSNFKLRYDIRESNAAACKGLNEWLVKSIESSSVTSLLLKETTTKSHEILKAHQTLADTTYCGICE